MASERHCRQLADRIREILKLGITLDHEVMHYIDSTYSMPTAEELHMMLSEPADSQDASLCELIFSPDEMIQLQIEGLLEGKAFQKADEENEHAFCEQGSERWVLHGFGWGPPLIKKSAVSRGSME